MKIPLISLLTLIGFAFAASAESTTVTKSESETEASSKRTCRIIFPERPNDASKVAYLYDGRSNHRVNLPTMNFSRVMELPKGERTITLSPSKITDPKNIPTEAPQLTVKANVQDFYILISPDRANPTLPLQMRLINISDEELKPGQTLWINLTDHQITGVLGDQAISVRPKSETVLKSPMSSSGYYRTEFSYQSDAKGEVKKIAEQQWWHDANSRHLGFIVDTGGRLPKIYFYRDFR